MRGEKGLPMSNHNESNLDNNDQERLKELLRRTGEFIAYFEIAEDKMINWKNDIEKSLAQHQRQIESQLEAIQSQCKAMNETMTEVGAARWRIAAEKALAEGALHRDEIKSQSEKFIQQSKVERQQLNQIAKKNIDEIKKTETLITLKINNIIKRLNLSQIKDLAEHSKDLIEESAHTAVFQHQKLLKQFRLKNIALVLSVVVLTSISIGLFLNDEMPWEIHKHAKQERMAGKALINAWPGLGQDIKDKILQNNT
jgi:dGTP triphosphohydrolase